MHRFAVILTHNRPELLHETWLAIGPQVDLVLIIDNASSPPVDGELFYDPRWRTGIVDIPDQPPNISALWNAGIEIALIQYVANPQPDAPLVAVLCDDAPPPPGWFDAVTEAMKATGAVIGCSAPEPFGWVGPPRLKTEPDRDVVGRMPGWAWIIDPSRNVRADEQFEWWWGDSDMCFRARQAGGMVQIGTHPVPNNRYHDFSNRPVQAAQIAADSQRFVDKWGYRPW
jgi:hypothetical protein